MRRVELFELIRQDFYALGLSKREIASRRRVHQRTVRQAIASAVPPERKSSVRPRPVLTEEVRTFIDEVLNKDKKAPRKQRHTARRIWQRVTDELQSPVAEPTVRKYVRERKRELGVGVQAFVPQHHPPGDQAEVDFYEAIFSFPWGQENAQIIITRSEFSAAALHVAYPSQTQAAFFEGIELGFEFLGGAFSSLRLDNLTQAVARVLSGSRRQEQDRFISFRSHYLFNASFTTPGKEGAHEKGGVEGEVGRFRRRWLTPVPSFASWEEANTYLRDCCIADLGRKLQGETQTVGEKAELEHAYLRALPEERFDTAEVAEPRVDQKARIQVRTNRYSVPASLVGRKVSVRLLPRKVEVSYGGRIVAAHDRLHLKCQENLVLDHYLDVLLEKPGAFPGSLPLRQAREKGDFPPAYDRLWEKLRRRYGEKPGTKKMIEVLLLHRSHPKAVVRAAVDEALLLGAIDSSAVMMLVRGADATRNDPVPLDVGELSRYDRPLPETTLYDALLTGVTR